MNASGREGEGREVLTQRPQRARRGNNRRSQLYYRKERKERKEATPKALEAALYRGSFRCFLIVFCFAFFAFFRGHSVMTWPCPRAESEQIFVGQCHPNRYKSRR